MDAGLAARMKPCCTVAPPTEAGQESKITDDSQDQQSSKKSTAFAHNVRIPRHFRQTCTTRESASLTPNRLDAPVDGRHCSPSLISDAELPPGHTYQPYFWISHLARKQTDTGQLECESVKSQIIAALTMSENKARKAFNQRFEYQFVDPGQSQFFKENPITQTGPVKSYGIFAKTPIAACSFLGIFSGTMYSLMSTGCNTSSLELKQQTPDMMSHHRMVSAIFAASAQGHLTPSIFTILRPSKDRLHKLYLIPDNGRFTPMHFINCTQQSEKANVAMLFTTIDTDSGLFSIPIMYSTRKINSGEQLLSEYRPSPFPNTVKPREVSAERERDTHHQMSQRYFANVQALNRLLDRTAVSSDRVSVYNAAPVIYLSEELRKSAKKPRTSSLSSCD